MLAAVCAAVLGSGLTQDRTLNVFAAASLKEAFTALAKKYEAGRPGLTVKLNFAGSQTLATQINNGAPADVFASAAPKNLDDVSYDKASYRIFVLNKLEIAVRKGFNQLKSVADLSRARNLVIADPTVPVGHYTESFLTKAGADFGSRWVQTVRSHVVSREVDVKAVLAKVRLGEADAGIVYVSDVISARGQIGEVAIPDKLNEVAEYPAAIPTSAANKDDAKHFIKFLLDADSQRSFERDGFISVTHPVASLPIFSPMSSWSLNLPISSKIQRVSVQATNERKQTSTYKGVLVMALPGFGAASQATFVGADRYSQTISINDLKSRKAVLVRSSDGNYQLVVPGMKPSVWVNWLRRIELR